MSATAARGPGPRRRGRALAILVTALAVSAPGGAQEQAPEPAQAATQPAQAGAPGQESVSPAEPTKDLFDLLRELRHKPPPPPPDPDDYRKWMIAAAPVLTYGPTSGFGIGLAGNMAFYRGFPDTTRMRSTPAGAGTPTSPTGPSSKASSAERPAGSS